MAEENTDNSYLDSMLSDMMDSYLEQTVVEPYIDYKTYVEPMLPSEDKSAGENLLDIVSMIPGIGSIKAAKPILEMMTPQMRGMMLAKKGRAKSRKTTKVLPGQRLGGSRLANETRDVMANFYKETRGGAFPQNLTPNTIEALKAIKPDLIKAASRDKQASRQGIKRILEIMEDIGL
jgi:hypothetical protein